LAVEKAEKFRVKERDTKGVRAGESEIDEINTASLGAAQWMTVIIQLQRSMKHFD